MVGGHAVDGPIHTEVLGLQPVYLWLGDIDGPIPTQVLGLQPVYLWLEAIQ